MERVGEAMGIFCLDDTFDVGHWYRVAYLAAQASSPFARTDRWKAEDIF